MAQAISGPTGDVPHEHKVGICCGAGKHDGEAADIERVGDRGYEGTRACDERCNLKHARLLRGPCHAQGESGCLCDNVQLEERRDPVGRPKDCASRLVRKAAPGLNAI